MLYQSATQTANDIHTTETNGTDRTGTAFVIGGAIWVVYFLGYIAAGAMYGTTTTRGTAFILLSALFVIALAAINGGLVMLGLRLRKRAAILASIGVAIALLAGASPVVGFFTRVIFGEIPGAFAGLGVIGSCLSATVLGVAAFRSRGLPRRMAELLVALGLLTFPLVIVFAMIAGILLPAYLADEIPFALAGVAWVVFGRVLKRV